MPLFRSGYRATRLDEPSVKDLSRLVSSRIQTGRIVFQDDFEGILKWEGSGSGSLAKNTTYAVSGGGSLGITTGTAANNQEEALFEFGSLAQPLSRLGLEFYFNLPVSLFAYFFFGLEFVSANRKKWIRSMIRLIGGLYENEAGVMTQLPNFLTGFDMHDSYRYWHHAKLIVDLEAQKYVSLWVDDYFCDLETLGFKCYNRGSPALWGVVYPYFLVQKDGSATGALTCLVDDVILTVE